MIDILQKDKEIWDLFTRKEEYNSPIRDKYDRFPYYASSNRNVFDPCVSKYLIDNGYRVQYPDNKSFAVCLTHDIDFLYGSILNKCLAASQYIRQGNPNKALHFIAKMRSKNLPFCNFSTIMDLEEKYGAKSTFFFMVESLGEQDYFYTIENLELELGEIIDRGMEVGLHGGQPAYLNAQMMKEKKERLEKIIHKPVIGYRNHFLRFMIPDTWENLDKAGFQYDTTLAYADCVGFRNGMCHPFRPYNLMTYREIDIFEIPLIIMDNALDLYMKLDNEKAWELIKRLINTVAQYYGVLTLLWHNNSFYDDKGDFYERILKYCAEKGAWMTSGEEITKWITNYNTR